MTGPIELATVVGLACPVAALALVATASLLGRPLSERVTGRAFSLALLVSAAAFTTALAALAASPGGRVELSVGHWYAVEHRAFTLSLLLDGWSLGFALLTAISCLVVSVFSNRYLHREPGYNRYFVLFGTFVTGMLLVSLAGSMGVLFVGWELLGISSTLLVAFFHDRTEPVRNALRVFVVYRLSDAAMIGAAIIVHHDLGGGSLAVLFSGAGHEAATLSPVAATAVAVLLALAAAGKSAQLPLSGWLPRAMEGPTPSSAVYYGALSVHAGALLLLRAAPLLDRSLLACLFVGSMGLTTAVYATVAGRVQTDIKCALAYASLTQVGIIFVEIAVGLRWIAFLHMVGHAGLRLVQFLRAPTLLHDFHESENAVGGHLARTGLHLERIFPAGLRARLYRVALERGYVDDWLDLVVVGPFTRLARALDTLERRWCDVVAGEPSPGLDGRVEPHAPPARPTGGDGRDG